jgi:secreted PhoX family phosphatase
MTTLHDTPRIDFNDENSNTTANASFESVLGTRLSRRSLFKGASLVGAAAGATALSGCATTTDKGAAHAINTLGFKPVAKSLADAVVVPEGYTAHVIYALGDPLTGQTPAFKNDGTDTDWGNRAGDHHDGIEWFGLDASGQASDTFASRGLLAMNHEATTDEKLSSFFIHANGGTATLPRPAAEIDKELMIHGISVAEVQTDGKQWAYKPASGFNRRVTTMSEVVLSGPAKGSEHLVTVYSPDGSKARGTLNNCGTGKTPWGTFVSGEENWFGYFFRDAKDDERVAKWTSRCRPSTAMAARPVPPAATAGKVAVRPTATRAGTMAHWPPQREGRLPQRNEHLRLRGGNGRRTTPPPSCASAPAGPLCPRERQLCRVVAGQPVVAYMGDDARGEYMYKFVSAAVWDAERRQPNNRLAAGDKYLDKRHAVRGPLQGRRHWRVDGTVAEQPRDCQQLLLRVQDRC